MSTYVITTDTTCDLPEEFLKEHNIDAVPLYYAIDDVIYGEDQHLSPKELFDLMRDGKMPTTMAANPETITNYLRKHLENGKDILHIAFSSGLSSTYNAAVIAANELAEAFPDRTITVIDSKAASMGEGLMVYKAQKNLESGMSLSENAEWLENNKLHFCHLITVNDLNHLHRGGRVSKTTAVIGTMINVKPIIHVDDEGKLIPISNVRGRKKSLNTLVDKMGEVCEGYENDIIFISHGDCLEDAEYVASQIKERFGIDAFMYNYVCSTIGSHTGPGVVALFYMGEHR